MSESIQQPVPTPSTSPVHGSRGRRVAFGLVALLAAGFLGWVTAVHYTEYTESKDRIERNCRGDGRDEGENWEACVERTQRSQNLSGTSNAGMFWGSLGVGTLILAMVTLYRARGKREG